MTSVSGAGIEEDGKHSSVRSSYMDEADEEAIPSGQVSCTSPQPVALRTLDSLACGPSRQLIAALQLCAMLTSGLAKCSPRARARHLPFKSSLWCRRRL